MTSSLFSMMPSSFALCPEKTPLDASMKSDAKAEKVGGSMRLIDGSMKAKAGESISLLLLYMGNTSLILCFFRYREK